MDEDVNYYDHRRKVKVNHPLVKTSQPPSEDINGEEGRIIQKLADGYMLVEFYNLFSEKEKAFFKWRGKKTPLVWYVHESDLTRI